MTKNILIAAGGTGGHFFPALAVALMLRDRGARVYWAGTEGAMEQTRAAVNHFSFHSISVSLRRRRGLWPVFKLPFLLVIAVLQAMRVIRSIKPCCVLAMGGYTAAPWGLAAYLAGRPLIIHEQNAVAGLANKILAPLARRIMIGMPGAFAEGKKVIVSGNPVRSTVFECSAGDRKSRQQRRILIVGGSQGARVFNRQLPVLLARVNHSVPLAIHHQSGRADCQQTRDHYLELGLQARVEKFIDDIAKAYQWADLVICRAGAMTLAELAAAARTSLLIPLPSAAADHQTANAHCFVRAGAALMWTQSQLTDVHSPDELAGLLNDDQRLHAMEIAAGQLSKPGASQLIADHCFQLCETQCNE